MSHNSQNQLFVGRLPRSCQEKDLEDIFYRYGKMLRCDIKTGLKMSYGFIEYEDKRDAEDAIDGEHGRDMMGSRIVVEWARGPKYKYRRDDNHHGDSHYDDDRRRSPPRRDYRRRSRSNERDSGKRPTGSYDRQYGSHDRRSPPLSHDRRSRSPDDRRGRSRSPSH
ncbi:probable splicing factor, arginine/serine-rich 5 [Halichondria panicea]|uniref:probable splicing factor, arginine/serine-rich 5 n=1 Tax=Halichondria panicea TaxID=6063 RepID=UPI00312B432C